MTVGHTSCDSPPWKQFGFVPLSVDYSGGLLLVRSAEVGCFELAVARFRAEVKTDTARTGRT